MAGIGEIKITSGLKFGHCRDCIFWRDGDEPGWQLAMLAATRDQVTDFELIEGRCHAHAPITKDGFALLPITKAHFGCGEFQDFTDYQQSMKHPTIE